MSMFEPKLLKALFALSYKFSPRYLDFSEDFKSFRPGFRPDRLNLNDGTFVWISLVSGWDYMMALIWLTLAVLMVTSIVY